MKQGLYIVTDNIQLTPTTWRMMLEGDVSEITAPGQFINIKLDGHFLRRPISVCDVGEGTVTIIYKVLGKGTEEMTHFAPGTSLDVLTGLGNGYDITYAGERPLLIGGGVGIPPLYLLAKELLRRDASFKTEENESDARSKSVRRPPRREELLRRDASLKIDADNNDARSKSVRRPPCREELLRRDASPKIDTDNNDAHDKSGRVTVILGFNGADEIYYVDEFKALGCDVIVATADGSAGLKGFVTDAFEQILNEEQESGNAAPAPFTHFYTCGPEPMLRAIYKKVYEEAGISGQMSYEERMGCGFGACMGCSMKTKNGNKRVCKDGPVFRTEEVIW